MNCFCHTAVKVKRKYVSFDMKLYVIIKVHFTDLHIIFTDCNALLRITVSENTVLPFSVGKKQ